MVTLLHVSEPFERDVVLVKPQLLLCCLAAKQINGTSQQTEICDSDGGALAK
jgi:hypothetical protein